MPEPEAASRSLDGLILVDKPEGPTSHDIVDAVRRTLGGVKCGHAGTLDPFATGLLVLAVGKATRLLRFLAESEKSYEGLVRLGLATDTDDRTGRPLGELRPVSFSGADLQSVLAAFEGEFDQIAPDYSARRHLGERHYRLARRGREVPKKPVRVRVRWEEWRLLEPGLLWVRLTVSAGTYIRALARDLGEALGCGGHLAALRRISSGPFTLGEAVPASGGAELLRTALMAPESIPLALPTVRLDADEARRFRSGGVVSRGTEDLDLNMGAMGWIRLLDERGKLLGIGQVDRLAGPVAAPVVAPRIVF